jgi:hypothetical protein
MRSIVPTLLIVLALSITASPARAQSWQVGFSPTFLSGTYGSGERTEIFYAPVVAKRLFRDGDLTLVLPYLCVRGAAGITVIGESPVRTGAAGATTTTITTPTRPSAPATRTNPAGSPTRTGAVTSTPAPISRTCGMGDTIVRGRYYVLDERSWMPTIALRAHVKAPTADADRGLGTGRIDEGLGVEITRTLGRGLSVMADGGYTFLGEPDDLELHQPWWYDLGVGQDLGRGAVNVSVFFEEYRAILPGLPNARDVLAAVTLKGGGWQAQISAQLGASDGAAERGLTVGISRRF